MTNRRRSSPAVAVAGAFALLAAAGWPAMAAAQAADSEQAAADASADDVDEVIEVVEEADQVRVTGSRVVSEGLLAGQADRIELTYWVSYADLEPAQDDAARELEERVGAAAEHICERLAEMYPVGAPEPEVCVLEAYEQAIMRLDETAGRAGR